MSHFKTQRKRTYASDRQKYEIFLKTGKDYFDVELTSEQAYDILSKQQEIPKCPTNKPVKYL